MTDIPDLIKRPFAAGHNETFSTGAFYAAWQKRRLKMMGCGRKCYCHHMMHKDACVSLAGVFDVQSQRP